MLDDELYGTKLFSKALFDGGLFRPVLWTPPTDGTNPLWLKADNINNFIFPDTLEPLLAGTWLDKSGNTNNATQTTQSLQPAYDSVDKSLNFNLDRMILPSLSSPAGFVVVRNANGSSGSGLVAPIIGDIASDYYIFLRTNSIDYTISIDGNGAQSGDASVNGNAIQPGTGLGQDINITNDGYTGFPDHNETDLVYWQTVIGNYTYDRLASFGSGFNAKVDIHEIIMLPSIPSEALRQKYEGYLAWEYGFVAKLPSGHPYKLRPPYGD